MNDFIKKYNWVLMLVCSSIFLIRYIRIEQSLWELGGAITFALWSVILYKQSRKSYMGIIHFT